MKREERQRRAQASAEKKRARGVQKLIASLEWFLEDERRRRVTLESCTAVVHAVSLQAVLGRLG